MMGEGQPLPQSDEVLVCNTDTTLDEASYHLDFISQVQMNENILCVKM